MIQNSTLLKIKYFILIFAVAPIFSGCVTRRNKPDALSFDEPSAKANIEKQGDHSAALEKMDKALAAFALKEDSKEFSENCLDKHFDCFVNEKKYPKKKKKIARKVSPFASGSKMGLRGEDRVQIRYDFYP